ncbi:5-oxoprolinase subunit C family protein [Rhodococcus sp. NPDC055024]
MTLAPIPNIPTAPTVPAIEDHVRVVDPGTLTTVQDLGRPGYAHLGVSSSGGADRASLMSANRLVGNSVSAPVFETTLGGLTFELSDSRYIAVTGAPVTVCVNGRTVSESARLYVQTGERVQLGRPSWGLRTYVAIAGGIGAPRVFGSASRDTLAGLGPPPVQRGDDFPLPRPSAPVTDCPLENVVSRVPVRHAEITFRWGPRETLFTDADRARFTRTRWLVSSQTDRVGSRLTGPALTIGVIDLPSEGMMRGAIQVPPSGEPIVFLADHPVTGGYPVIGVVIDADIALLAQAAPGTTVRFTPAA